LAGYIQKIGDTMIRLGKKSDFLSVSFNNTDAVRSQYEDADFAVEQMELLKLQILQGTSVSSLSQANSAPQVVLGLFR
jgi:flagellin